ncbi:hypothetical protein [Actinoplanes regularis]|uniref:Uncharacterized protein n=1 Tax=Actinoplanes regularis TaxID=52697 RepID=A0A238WQK4_9ACTN|nr:hypothetical protein [Actinoplanes regularis]GIE84634.1 hypothetical protein Are01nite_11140 [Actinoplanes regularis]GLW33016.1 hypothetical protein Areg01_59540 [Actinoplanes regularis]SNR48688.1 hypothetical protein SAMN06264365_102787 [Actinoplanes regularis]
MKPALQPEDDAYVVAVDTLEKVDRELIDSEALQATLDRIIRDEPVAATAFTNFVS